MRAPVSSFLIVAGALSLSAPARADAIDGNWCDGEGGRRISIEGPLLVTPGGAKVQGDYSRHSFSYVTPTQEPEAGQKVDMLLMSETSVQVRTGGDPRSTRGWQRCAGTTS